MPTGQLIVDGLTAGSYFAVITDPLSGNVWSGSGNNFVATSGAAIADAPSGICLPLSPDSIITSRQTAAFPSGITTPAEYLITVWAQAGANPASSDLALPNKPVADGTALPPGSTAVGWYSSQARIELLARSLGDVFSNVNNDSTAPDTTRYQAALNRTDNTINALAALADYVVPLAASASFPGGISGSAFGYIQDRADVLALWDLYSLPRGAYDAPGKDPAADKLKGLADAARQELIDLFASGVLTAARNAGYVSAPAALDTFDAWGHRIDASGNRLDAPPPIYWPLWRR